MRAFELALLISLVLTIFLRQSAPFAKSNLLLIFLISTSFFCHFFFEGFRWQMTGLYFISFVLIFLILIGFSNSFGARITLALASILGASLAIAIPVFKLPLPSGQYAIGTKTYEWNDTKWQNLFDANQSHEMIVQIYYPAEKEKNPKFSPYVPPKSDFSSLADLLHLPPFFFDHFKYVKTHAQINAPIINEKFPLLIFSHGRGGFRNHNLSQVEDLVSHGYVVASVDYPYAAADTVFENGRHIKISPKMMGAIEPEWNDEVTEYFSSYLRFVSDKISLLAIQDPFYKGHIDTSTIGLFGVSLGGMISAQTAGPNQMGPILIMDSYIPSSALKSGFRAPLMIISRGKNEMLAEKWPESIADLHQETMHQAVNAAQHDSYFLDMRGAFHVNFSDAFMYVYEPLGRALGFLGNGNGRSISKNINKISLAFFDKYVKYADAKIECGVTNTNYSIECSSNK